MSEAPLCMCLSISHSLTHKIVVFCQTSIQFRKTVIELSVFNQKCFMLNIFTFNAFSLCHSLSQSISNLVYVRPLPHRKKLKNREYISWFLKHLLFFEGLSLYVYFSFVCLSLSLYIKYFAPTDTCPSSSCKSSRNYGSPGRIYSIVRNRQPWPDIQYCEE